MSKLKYFYEFHIEKKLTDIFVVIIVLSILYMVMRISLYYEDTKIENKFINSLNDKKYDLAISFICKDTDLKVNNEENIQKNILSEYKISKFLDEDKNTFVGEDFRIDEKYFIKDSKKASYKNRIVFSYDYIYKDYLVKFKRVNNKMFYVKEENGKECISNK